MKGQIVSLKTHDGEHYLRLYHPDIPREDGREGQLWADATAAGPDETFEVEAVSGGMALKCHGRYVTAEADGRITTRTYQTPGPWEIWTPVLLDDGRLAFSSHHGRYLCAEGGGGGAVVADRLAVGVWEQFTPSAALAAPGTLTRLRVEGNRRYVANDAGRFDWREVSAFSLLSRLLAGEDAYVQQWLTRRRAEGFTVTRVFLTLDGDYWTRSPLGGRSFRCAPDMPWYWTILDRLVQLHADAGLYVRVVFLGALEPFGGVWHPDRRDVFAGAVRERAEAFVVEAAQRLGRHAHVIGELANEPTEIGMREAWANGALVALGRKCKAVAPDMLLCLGENNDAAGVAAPADFADAHMDRSRGVEGWEWIKRSGEHPTADQPVMPFVAGEPINFGEDRADGRTGDVERQPAVAFGAAAVGRARRWAGQCFHYDGGLWTTEPTPETLACIRAWHEGMDAFPMLTDPVWRGHWGLPRGDYWRDVWPNTDDARAVEDHVRAGRGPWRAFGCGPYSIVFPEPQEWDYTQALDAPATRVTRHSAGTFACGVYRKL